MENVEISHLCGHVGYVSPRVSDEESATLVERPCPGCTPADRWAEDANARMLDDSVCRNCGERGTLRLLYVLVASAPTAQSLAGVQVVIDGIRYVLCTRCSWRELPEQFGPWKTAYSRYTRWKRNGLWSQIETALADPVTADLSDRH